MNTNIRATFAFPEIGIIRKGDAKRTVTKNGCEVQTVGQDLGNRFRVVFFPGTGDAEAVFKAAYGSLQPQRIQAMLPFRTTAACWSHLNETYMKGRQVAAADDLHYITRRDPITGEYQVRNGEPFVPYTPGEEITYSRDGQNFSLKSRPVGRLRLFLPVFERLVTVTLKTTSFYDCINIDQQLGAIEMLAESLNGGNCSGIPFWIYRRETEITWHRPDGATRIKKWLVNIEADQDWVKAAIKRLRTQALGEGQASTPLLPEEATAPIVIDAGPGVPDPEQDVDEELEDENIQPEPDPEPTYTPAPVHNTRPFAPEVLKHKLAARAATLEGKASQSQIGLVAHVLEQALSFSPDPKLARHIVIQYLTGKSSLNDVPDQLILAMMKWLNPTKDSGGEYYAEQTAVQEAVAVLDAAMPQQEMLF